MPVLNSPRNPLSRGAGILEYIFFSLTEGILPIFLLGIFILIILFTNRFFCGWICPIGTIQDGCAALTTKKRTLKPSTHNSLLKLKYIIIIFLIILLIPLAVTYSTNLSFYLDYKNNLGDFGDKPLSYFSLSEYIFEFFPNMVKSVFQAASLGPLFKNLLVFLITIFYLIILILSVWYPRVYCRYICPFAALSSAIS
ncbi:MAG: 4Fe-4S binding protein, partial [Promethearchaeota archaeon]